MIYNSLRRIVQPCILGDDFRKPELLYSFEDIIDPDFQEGTWELHFKGVWDRHFWKDATTWDDGDIWED